MMPTDYKARLDEIEGTLSPSEPMFIGNAVPLGLEAISIARELLAERDRLKQDIHDIADGKKTAVRVSQIKGDTYWQPGDAVVMPIGKAESPPPNEIPPP